MSILLRFTPGAVVTARCGLRLPPSFGCSPLAHCRVHRGASLVAAEQGRRAAARAWRSVPSCGRGPAPTCGLAACSDLELGRPHRTVDQLTLGGDDDAPPTSAVSRDELSLHRRRGRSDRLLRVDRRRGRRARGGARIYTWQRPSWCSLLASTRVHSRASSTACASYYGSTVAGGYGIDRRRLRPTMWSPGACHRRCRRAPPSPRRCSTAVLAGGDRAGRCVDDVLGPTTAATSTSGSSW